jgi:hypothetical protein
MQASVEHDQIKSLARCSAQNETPIAHQGHIQSWHGVAGSKAWLDMMSSIKKISAMPLVAGDQEALHTMQLRANS